MIRIHRFPFVVGLAALVASACGRPEPATTPAQLAQRVATRIVEDTRFHFNAELMETGQDGSFLVDLADGGTAPRGSAWVLRSVIHADSSVAAGTRVKLGLSADPGRISARLNGSVVAEATWDGAFYLDYPDYGYFRYSAQPEVSLQPGANELVIVYETSGSGARVAFGVKDRQSGLRPSGVTVVSPVPDETVAHYPVVFRGPMSPADAGRVAAEGFVADAPVYAWRLPQPHLVSAIDDRLSYSDWRYFTGTFLDAMYRVQDAFPDQDYTEYINRHLDFFLDNRDAVAAERQRLHLRESAFGHYFRYRLLDDVGMQSVPYLERYRRSLAGGTGGRPEDLPLVQGVVDHILNGADRLPDGTFARLTPDSMSVWADDLFMGSVVLSRAAGLLNRPELFDEVARQVVQFDGHLKDEATGLYWHGWFNTQGRPSSSKWARANGWTMVAKMFALEVLPENHPRRGAVLDAFRDHAVALLAVQSADGRWHQILDNPSTYLETSATAMFTAAFATGVTNGWLDRQTFDDAIRKGWAAVLQQADENGNVEGIVRGTPIMFSDQEYHEHPPRRNDPRGLGAILYCAVAMDTYLSGS